MSLRFGLGWAKSLTFVTGQCPVKRYNRGLLNLILHRNIDFAKMINVKVVSLQDAPLAYKSFDQGEAAKYVIDPHGIIQEHFNKSKAKL